MVLLSRLNVDPEECTLGSQDPEEVAWRIVRWFEDRGRVEELDRAARVGWTRRLLRRLSLASVATGLVGFALMFGADLFNVQARMCRLPLGQPALADACGAWGLGGLPAKEERVAWESRERGSCAALRGHLTKFPSGAYRNVAHARLTARAVMLAETWTAREQALELFVGRDAPPARDRAAAEAVVQQRAQAEAERLCRSFVASGQHRLRAARTEGIDLKCDSVKGGVVCSLAGQARCALDERGLRERESCQESSTP